MGGWLDVESEALLREAAERLDGTFAELPGAPARSPEVDRMGAVLLEAAGRLGDNFPYFHPLYAGQMLKPPHPVARLAYALAMRVNPNNHALDGGRASSAMEKEAVSELAAMFGWSSHLGHLCSGGTMANLEALWVAGRMKPGLSIVASSQAHYTHARLCGVLGLSFEAIPCDPRGRMDTKALASRLGRGGVGTVVATLGTTATGAVDPLPEILALRARHDLRLHVDAAYGGYFTLASSLEPSVREAFDRAGKADSIVIDPHKHGLQPYGCGCILFREPEVGRLYKHDSPYTYFTSTDLHLGEITLECSRPGASAVALWATQRLLPLTPGGEFARGLDASRAAALDLHARLAHDPRFVTGTAPDLDIVVWAPRARRVSEASASSRRIFEEAARRGLHLALASLPVGLLGGADDMQADEPLVTCLRSVLMKPEHAVWMDRIWERLDQAATAVLRSGS
ncbi:MAG: pyridoxal phosphate-dependent decarboxylase family protein [Candidatus Polarisedimenticolia bacterium]